METLARPSSVIPRDATVALRAAPLRWLLQWALLFPVVAWFCRPFSVRGRERLEGTGPFVFVANHSSHADTAVILRALPARIRRRTAVAAADDYFFSSRVKGWIFGLLVGAFPFPRRGGDGIRRARHLLDRGWSVILYPEGTRSRRGQGEFRSGVGMLASSGATIVPVGVAGTASVLTKGSRLPRRNPVTVTFGRPRPFPSDADPHWIASSLRDQVRWLELESRCNRGSPARVYDRFATVAASAAAAPIAFAWGVCEALIWPIVPDFYVAPLALALPARWWRLTLATIAGTVVGGSAAYAIGAFAPIPISDLPLVTVRMTSTAGEWLTDVGPRALLRQPMSGIPFKVFGYQAADAGIGPVDLVTYSAVARGLRLVAVGATFAAAGALFRKWVPRAFGVLMVVYVVLFVAGLSATIDSWR